MLARSGVRRAAGGVGLHRGRELLREIPRTLTVVLTCGDHVGGVTLRPDVFLTPQVIHTFLVSFNEQRRPIMPLLTAMRRTQKLSEEQRALREAWDALTEKVGKTSCSAASMW